MNSAMLLARLEGVRRSGDGWRANCPNGHATARGSLSIMEADDGRILLSCFACHDTRGILRTLGLELADLFPERIRDPSPEARRAAREAFKRSAWAAALGVLGRESLLVLLAARSMRVCDVPSENDVERLALAEDRIARAREVLA
jgi:hypothetical protein